MMFALLSSVLTLALFFVIGCFLLIPCIARVALAEEAQPVKTEPSGAFYQFRDMTKHMTLSVLVAFVLLGNISKSADVPFPSALDESAIRQKQMSHIMDNSLIFGNGDLNGLLFSSGNALVLRLTKNDVWDARIDTSEDPPLMKVDLSPGQWTATPDPKSWSNPYPCPPGVRASGAGRCFAGSAVAADTCRRKCESLGIQRRCGGNVNRGHGGGVPADPTDQ